MGATATTDPYAATYSTQYSRDHRQPLVSVTVGATAARAIAGRLASRMTYGGRPKLDSGSCTHGFISSAVRATVLMRRNAL